MSGLGDVTGAFGGAGDAQLLLRNVKLLNLLGCFADSFAAQPEHQRLMFEHIPGTQGSNSCDVYRTLGALFLSLASYLLGAQFEGRTSQQNALDSATSTPAVASLFGVSVPVASAFGRSAADAGSASSITTSNALPVQWLVLQLTVAGASLSVKADQGAMDVASSPTYVALGDSSDPSAEGHAPLDSVPEEVFTDYVQAAGWKKLEYRVTGLRRGIAAAQERALIACKANAAEGSVLQTLVQAVPSLERLVSLLTRKEVVAALTNSITITTSTGVDNSASSTAAVDNPVTVVELYTQALLTFPGDVSPGAGRNHSAVLTADGKASMLIALAFANPAAPLARRLWHFVQQRYLAQVDAMLGFDDATLLHTKGFTDVADRAAGGAAPSAETLYRQVLSALYLFCAVFLQQLAAVDDETLLEQQKLFSVQELRGITIFLKRWLFKLYWSDPLFDIHSSFYHVPSGDCTSDKLLKLHCQMAATRLFNHLCIRNERRNFLQAEDWGWPQLSGFDLSIREDLNLAAAAEANYGSTLLLKNAKVKSVLTFIPQV
jgi:hypothetical protein